MVRRTLLHKDGSSMARKGECKYRSLFGMMIYLQVLIHTYILVVLHQCKSFINNKCLMHKHVMRYLASAFIYIDISYGNFHSSIHRLIYKLYKEKGIKCYFYADFSGG